MKQQIQTQSASWRTKIKNKLFSTRKMKVFSAIVFLAVGGTVFFSINYFAKGATYGWLQATWSGGADTNAVANHTNNKTGWTKFFSKSANVDTSNDQITLSSGSSSVTDTTTANFDAGADTNGTTLSVTHAGDELKLNLGYNASGICGNFYVLPLDYGGATPTVTNWTTAGSYCDSLCPTCDLPSYTELDCICINKASFGNNFVGMQYWSVSSYNTINAYYTLFGLAGSCSTSYSAKTNSFLVRCIRRF